MKKFIAYLVLTATALSIFAGSQFVGKISETQAAAFDYNSLVTDGGFVGIDSMNVAEIQVFLSSRGSYLANYTEGGKSAAQIIWDAAHGAYPAAVGSSRGIDINSSTGTVSPAVILVTLQKEQSLITTSTRNDGALSCAMGYEGGNGCNWMRENKPAWSGFANQVGWGAWQLRWNFEAAHHKSASWWASYYTSNNNRYYAGNTITTQDGYAAYLSNSATAALYRYTPYVYNGNYNFWNLYHNIYKFQVLAYQYSVVSQSNYPTVNPGVAFNLRIVLQNTGTVTWKQSTFHLGTDRVRDRIPGFGRGYGWASGNRVAMEEKYVAPGSNATFLFTMTVPKNMSAGTYREYFRPLVEGVTWMPDKGIYWAIKVPTTQEMYQYSIVSQSNYPTVARSGSTEMVLVIKNTGTATWRRSSLRLGTNRPTDRTPGFIRGDGWIYNNRIAMREATVAPGGNATFRFTLTIPSTMAAGTYKEYFRPVAEGVTWMPDYGIYWNIRVP